MRLGFVFSCLAVALAYFTCHAGGFISTALLANCTLAYLILSCSYFANSPRAFSKTRDGRIPVAVKVMLWPFLVTNGLTLKFFRFVSREDAFNEILPGLFLGCRLNETDKYAFNTRNIRSVLDVTAEFEELRFVRAGSSYHCIPVLDHSPPHAAQLREGVAFIKNNLSQGPVYVHCALGHGRSATFVAAYLLATGTASSAEGAVKFMQNRRPRAGLNARQLATLVGIPPESGR